MCVVHDDCKKALESLQDNGVYLVDKDRLAIYYMRKDSPKVHNLEPVQAAPETDILHTWTGLTGKADEQSPDAGESRNSETEPKPNGIWDSIPAIREMAMNPSHLLATISPVKNENGETVGAVQVFEDREEIGRIRERLQELEQMVLLDPLTRVGNRRYAEIQLQCCLDEMRRYNWPFGVLFIDVDYFKSINDRFGHNAGDAVLRVTANTLVSHLRSSDLVCRWGGEEFVVVLKNTGQSQIGPIAEKLRSLVALSCVPTDQASMGVTISVGATVARLDDSIGSLIHRADQLMYLSKREGRNRVTTDADGALL